jgi:hypothetical protein
MPSSQPTEPGSRSGGRPALGGGDLAEGAVGGPGGEAAGGLNREAARRWPPTWRFRVPRRGPRR